MVWVVREVCIRKMASWNSLRQGGCSVELGK